MAKVTISKDGTTATCGGCGEIKHFEMESGVQKSHADFARLHRICKEKAK